MILNRSDSFGVRSVNDLTHAVSKEDIVWITVSLCVCMYIRMWNDPFKIVVI